MFLIDTRNVEEFIQGHLQYSVFVGFKGGSFEHWLPKLLPNKKAEFKLISNPIDTDEVTQKLEDMGYHNFHSMTLETQVNWLNCRAYQPLILSIISTR